MHIEALFEGDGLRRMRELLNVHRSLLGDLKHLVSAMVANHEEIFRRDPESRIKRIRSIHKKVDRNGMKTDDFFERAAGLRDIAGIRLTIATKDQHPVAETLLRESLNGFGVLERIGSNGGLEIRQDGYSANHLVLVSSVHQGAYCEIQVRTLTQDLWAVFSHYEAYKRSRPTTVGVADELVNYAKLMDVADDFAKTIRRRKIREADERHRRACLDAGISGQGPDGILTFEVLEEIVNIRWPKVLPSNLQGGSVSTVRLCELLDELSNYSIYTANQLTELLGRTSYIQHIVTRMADVGIVGARSADVFFLLCTCYRVSQSEVRANELGVQMRAVIDGYLRAIQLEEDADRIFEQA